MENFKNYIVSENISIKEALNLIEKNIEKCLFAVDKNQNLKGSLTDGDIRRAILKKAKFNSKIKSYLYKKTITLNLKEYQTKKLSKISRFYSEEFKLIPVIDKFNKIIKIINLKKEFLKKNNFKEKANNIPVLIMAGGRGSRLKPYTDIIPKPLVPIKGKSMIEHIIVGFKDSGFKNFYVSLNYKGNLIRTFFSFLKKKYKINFLNEASPLGTAGIINKLKFKKNTDFFVINCDTILKCDFRSIYNFHLRKNYGFTIVASQQAHTIPYGVCKINKFLELRKIEEKPSQNVFVNTGCYIINSSLIKNIKKNQKIDMDLFISKLLKKKIKIGIFPIQKEDWSDYGKLTDLE